MQPEPTTRTRSGKKDKQDAPAKATKEPKAGKSTDKSDPPSKARELEMHEGEVKVDPSAFQIAFYMKHFRVTDIIVKVVEHTLVIDACHREHADEHGLITRSMIRKHKLPLDIKVDTLTSAFTGSGFLVVHGERLVELAEQN